MKHIIAVIVENKSGVLTRIARPLQPQVLQHRQPLGGSDG